MNKRCSVCNKIVAKTFSIEKGQTTKPPQNNRCLGCVDGHEFEMGMWKEDK